MCLGGKQIKKMFKAFPILSTNLLDTLARQHFLFFVKQYYGMEEGQQYYLYSPFKEDYKAVHYFERLHHWQQPVYFDTNNDVLKRNLYTMAAAPQAPNSFIKIIENNFKLDDGTRYKIAALIKQKYPEHFESMIKNNFRIVIGDNFGDVFYTVRIGQGILLPVREVDLENLSNYVPRPQQVLRFTTDL